MHRRERAREGFFTVWFVALLFGWLAPDGAVWVTVVQALLAVLWVGCGLVWLGGWVLARRRGDPDAQLDDRVVLAFGALAAGGAALLVWRLAGSEGWAVIAFVVGVALALAGSLRIGAADGRAQKSGRPSSGVDASA